jgi:hypothetical protein
VRKEYKPVDPVKRKVNLSRELARLKKQLDVVGTNYELEKEYPYSNIMSFEETKNAELNDLKQRIGRIEAALGP